MTAAKVVDVVAKLPDCDGQTADAVSAYTQVKLEDAPRLLNVPKSECPTYGYIFHNIHGPNHGQTLKIPSFFSNEFCMDIHSLVSCGNDNSKKLYQNLDVKKVPNWECLFCSSKTRIVLVGICGCHQNGYRILELGGTVADQ